MRRLIPHLVWFLVVCLVWFARPLVRIETYEDGTGNILVGAFGQVCSDFGCLSEFDYECQNWNRYQEQQP